MRKILSNKITFWTSLVSVLVLAVVTILTTNLLNRRSVAPERPQAVSNCVLSYSISTPTPTPTMTPTPRPTSTVTPTIPSTSTSTPTPRPTTTPTIRPTSTSTPTLTPTPRPTSTVTPTTALVGQCQDVRMYSSSWVLLSSSQLFALRPGNQIYFCARGSVVSSTGSFDRARFTVNNVLYPDTTLLRPGTTGEFCQSYTMPNSVSNFSVRGQIHHTILGWL